MPLALPFGVGAEEEPPLPPHAADASTAARPTPTRPTRLAARNVVVTMGPPGIRNV
ncbi:hypothetical protein GCM10027446_10310 [Angustibacter peucedani]